MLTAQDSIQEPAVIRSAEVCIRDLTQIVDAGVRCQRWGCTEHGPEQPWSDSPVEASFLHPGAGC